METPVLSQEEILQQKKIAHDYIATAIQIMTTRVQFFVEEFEGTSQSIQFLRNLRDSIRKEIEIIEPPTVKEDPKAYEMDLTHLKNEKAE